MQSMGNMVRRAKLDDVLLNAARADKVPRADIANLAFLDENHVVFYLPSR